MLTDIGEVHVSHRNDDPYNRWKLEKLAKRAGLVLEERVEFRKSDYPGYQNKRGGGINSNQEFPLNESFTFKFSLRDSSAMQQSTTSMSGYDNISEALAYLKLDPMSYNASDDCLQRSTKGRSWPREVYELHSPADGWDVADGWADGIWDAADGWDAAAVSPVGWDVADGWDVAAVSADGWDTSHPPADGWDVTGVSTDGWDVSHPPADGWDVAAVSANGWDVSHPPADGWDVAAVSVDGWEAADGWDVSHPPADGWDVAAVSANGWDVSHPLADGWDVAAVLVDGWDVADHGWDVAAVSADGWDAADGWDVTAVSADGWDVAAVPAPIAIAGLGVSPQPVASWE